MKKTLWIAIAGALVVSVVAASAQTEVLSANAVGYIKKTLPAGGKLVVISIPLDLMTGTGENQFGKTSIAEEAPTGSYVYFWDNGVQIWRPYLKSAAPRLWPLAASNYIVQPGEGFFMKGPASAVDNQDVTITGEVPSDDSLGNALAGGSSLDILANPYPVDFQFGKSQIAMDASTGSYVYFWDSDVQIWRPYLKSAAPRLWPVTASNYVVQAGESYFLKEPGAGYLWSTNKPYSWP